MSNTMKIVAASVALLTTLAGSARADTILDRIAAEILSAKFGISTTEIARVQKASGLSSYEIAPVLSASSYGKLSPNKVWELRRQGLGWGQIADRMGMHPGAFNKLRGAGAFDSGPIWDNALRSRFSVDGQDLSAARKRGASPQDTIAAILIGKSTHRNTESVFDEYDRDRDWVSMCGKHKVDFKDWKKSAKHPAAKKHGKHDDKAKGKSKGKSKGKGHGKGGG